MRVLRTQICDFLWFGYVPSVAKSGELFARYETLLNDATVEIFDWKDLASAKRLFVRIVEELTAGNGVDEICLPLSAGLDSRALLGAALEVFPADKICAFTLGHDGTDDFDRARHFTRDLLPNHLKIESVLQAWDTADRVTQVRRRADDHVTGLGEFSGIASTELREMKRSPQLKGFLGDALSGKKLPNCLSGRWADATYFYAHRFRAHKGPIAVTPTDYDPITALPNRPFGGGARMLLDDQIQFVFRQEQHIRRSFAGRPGPRSKLAHPIFPFDDPRWVRSFLLLPTQLRLQQPFYRHFLANAFPRIFPDLRDWRSAQALKAPPPQRDTAATEAETAQGGDTAKSSKSHIDFGTIYDQDSSFRGFCRENLTDLSKRKLVDWVDLDSVIYHAENGWAADLGRILYGLVSLEINLKAGRLPVPT